MTIHEVVGYLYDGRVIHALATTVPMPANGAAWVRPACMATPADTNDRVIGTFSRHGLLLIPSMRPLWNRGPTTCFLCTQAIRHLTVAA